MKQPTLFADITLESKAERRDRAKRIHYLLGELEDIPGAIDCLRGQREQLNYFIDRAKKNRLDPNDLDGMLRTVGEPMNNLAELTCADLRWMDTNCKWKRFPKGWCGVRDGAIYCAGLHPKEIKVIEEIRDSIADQIFALQHDASELETELSTLRAIGPLPDEACARLRLTPEGFRIPLHSSTANAAEVGELHP